MKKRLIPILLILLVIPLVSADDNDRTIVFIPTDGFYENLDADKFLETANQEELNAFLSKQGVPNGAEFLRGGVQQREDGTNGFPLVLANVVYQYMVDQTVQGFKDVADFEPKVVTIDFQVNLREPFNENEDEFFKRLVNHVSDVLDGNFDPKSDNIVEFTAGRNQLYLGQAQKLHPVVSIHGNNPSTYTQKEIATHELMHRGGVDGLWYCDEYHHDGWEHQNAKRLEITGKGCANEYDKLQCCSDNPRWKIEGKEAYQKHLKEIGMGKECLPKDWEDKPECKRKESYKPPLCYGNPCEAGDPGPPYCRTTMGVPADDDAIKYCFEGQYNQKKVDPRYGGNQN